MKKTASYLVSWVRTFGLLIQGLHRITKETSLPWLIHFLSGRYLYGLHALHAGIKLNHYGEGILWNFRRNIHRIEKGLLQKQLRCVFADTYISETVDYLRQLKSTIPRDKESITWGESILEQYFNTCDHSPTVAAAYELYQSLKPENTHPNWLPYKSRHRPELTIDYKELYLLALRRRSVRFYLDKPVDFELVERAMALAALSPTACNRQSFRFLFYNDKDLVTQISSIPGGFTGYIAPSIVVVTARYRGYFDERDVNTPIIDASLATMSFLLALETLGLASVCIGWPALPDRDEAIRRLIPLHNDEIVVILVAIGFADPEGKIAYSAKRDVSNLVLLNEKRTEAIVAR